MKIKIPDKIFGESINGSYQRYLDGDIPKQLTPETKTPINANPNFSLEDKVGFFRATGVQYRNGIYQVDLLKSLLNDGSSKTQDEWIEFSKGAIGKDGFRLGDFPIHYALFNALYQNRTNPKYQQDIEQAKEFIKKQMFEKWLMTSTRTIYSQSGKDLVIHNHGLPDVYTLQEDIMGPDEWITKTSNKTPYQALLGSDDVNQINNVFNWITDKNSYLWRVNSKQNTERVARFRADSDGVDLYCGRVPRYSDSALGVRGAKIKV